MEKAKYFDSFHQFREFCNAEISQLNSNNLSVYYNHFSESAIQGYLSDESWYGKGVKYEDLGNITVYKNAHLIDKMYESLSNNEYIIKVKNKLVVRKIRYNPMGLGVFVFDRAATSLYKTKEYYSSTHDKFVDKSETEKQGKSYVLKTDKTEVEEQERIRTLQNNVFAYFPKVKKQKKAIKFYVNNSHSATKTADEIIWIGVVLITIIRFLELYKIRSKVYASLVGIQKEKRHCVYGFHILTKDYHEPLDENILALITSDPAVFRYDFFKGILAVGNVAKIDIDSSLGTPADSELFKDYIKEDEQYKAEQSYTKTIFVSSVYNEKDAVNETIRILNEITNESDDT